MSRYQDLILRARNGETILLDGATGTECERRGVPQLKHAWNCLLYTSPSPRDQEASRMPSSA